MFSQGRQHTGEYLQAQIFFVAHGTYYMLKYNVAYPGSGGDYFERQDKTKIVKRLLHKLNALGLQVTVSPAM